MDLERRERRLRSYRSGERRLACLGPDGTRLAVWSKSPGGTAERLLIHDIRTGADRELLSSESRVVANSWVRTGRIGVLDYARGVAVLSVISPPDRLWTREAANGYLGV